MRVISRIADEIGQSSTANQSSLSEVRTHEDCACKHTVSNPGSASDAAPA